MLKTQKQTKK